jgi:hypothetical protein
VGIVVVVVVPYMPGIQNTEGAVGGRPLVAVVAATVVVVVVGSVVVALARNNGEVGADAIDGQDAEEKILH